MQLGNIKKLFTEERAVSPVIGVILMVAITVILAAVIGTFVLGLGDDLQDTSPTASFSSDFDTDDMSVTITHTGGDKIPEGDSLTVSVSGDSVLDGDGYWDGTEASLDDDVSAGSSATFDANGDWEGGTLRVNWESPNGDSSATLASVTIPDTTA